MSEQGRPLRRLEHRHPKKLTRWPPSRNKTSQSLVLHSHRERCIFFLWVGKRRRNGRKNRCLAGNSGADGAAHAGNDGTAARLRLGAPHRADQRRSAAVELRHALSGALEAGTGRFHPFALGRFRQQPPRKILRVDQGRPAPIEAEPPQSGSRPPPSWRAS